MLWVIAGQENIQIDIRIKQRQYLNIKTITVLVFNTQQQNNESFRYNIATTKLKINEIIINKKIINNKFAIVYIFYPQTSRQGEINKWIKTIKERQTNPRWLYAIQIINCTFLKSF